MHQLKDRQGYLPPQGGWGVGGGSGVLLTWLGCTLSILVLLIGWGLNRVEGHRGFLVRAALVSNLDTL